MPFEAFFLTLLCVESQSHGTDIWPPHYLVSPPMFALCWESMQSKRHDPCRPSGITQELPPRSEIQRIKGKGFCTHHNRLKIVSTGSADRKTAIIAAALDAALVPRYLLWHNEQAPRSIRDRDRSLCERTKIAIWIPSLSTAVLSIRPDPGAHLWRGSPVLRHVLLTASVADFGLDGLRKNCTRVQRPADTSL
ncbi:hypothetical protein LX36DRAFT_344115 [Colletotrichum falcatum]|nr:hypothetical protein LX36DRAFT_344115 [Colletotrichum falcatum]